MIGGVFFRSCHERFLLRLRDQSCVQTRDPTFQKVSNGPETRFHPCGDEANIQLFTSLFHEAKSNKPN